ncbi:MAG TPA: hypothetical protein VEJ63_23705 [Planctomycetota bacterium]|nr:hypothetical protein [Planctomycetota bacterium]
MAEPVPNNPQAGPSATLPPGPGPQKKSGIGCLGILAIIAGVMAVVMLIVGILVWQAISWVKNAPESTIAVAEPLNLSEGEKEDVARIVRALTTAGHEDKTIDESVTPRVFNGVIEFIMKEEEKKNNRKPDDAVAFRSDFKGDVMRIRVTVPAKDMDTGQLKQGMYLNVDCEADLEIVDGEFTKLDVKRVALGGKDAPLVARMFINWGVTGMKQAAKQAKADPTKNPDNPLRVIKLLKREGDRLHVVLDGAQFKDDK